MVPPPLSHSPKNAQGVPLSQWTGAGASQSEESWDAKRAALVKLDPAVATIVGFRRNRCITHSVTRGRSASQAMKLCHAAPCVLVAWYLMVPPLVHYDPLELPVSQWKMVQRFDTATVCEGYLQEMKEDPRALHGEYSVVPNFKMEGLKKMGDIGIGLFALKYARCIFSDDPHLDEN
jgi:hypothetical protein